jgi:hypothetical protein
MPQALSFDREVARSLVAQGFSFAEIARKTGVNQRTVSTWSRRLGWRNSDAEAASIMEPGGLIAASKRVRSRIASRIERASAVLDREPEPTSIKKLGEEQRQLTGLVDNASKVFGWDTGPDRQRGLSVFDYSNAAIIDIEPEQVRAHEKVASQEHLCQQTTPQPPF